MASGWGGSGGSDSAVLPGAVSRPTPLPDVLALLALLLSVLLYLWYSRLAAGGSVALPAAVVGYLATPFGVVAALVMARASGLRRMTDPWFDAARLRSQVKRLQVATFLGFIAALPHIFVIASWANTVGG
jgi:hypothetical protein